MDVIEGRLRTITPENREQHAATARRLAERSRSNAEHFRHLAAQEDERAARWDAVVEKIERS